MSPIKGGVVTVHGEAGAAHDVTFSNGQHGLLLTLTTEGRLVPSEGLARDAVTKEVAAMLVEAMGHAYGQPLHEAENRAKKAEAKLKSTINEMNMWKNSAAHAEAKLTEITHIIAGRPRPQDKPKAPVKDKGKEAEAKVEEVGQDEPSD